MRLISSRHVATQISMEPKTSNVFRIVFLGGPEVGKTSLIQRCIQGEFREKHTPTVEDMYFYKLNLPGKVYMYFYQLNLPGKVYMDFDKLNHPDKVYMDFYKLNHPGKVQIYFYAFKTPGKLCISIYSIFQVKYGNAHLL